MVDTPVSRALGVSHLPLREADPHLQEKEALREEEGAALLGISCVLLSAGSRYARLAAPPFNEQAPC